MKPLKWMAGLALLPLCGAATLSVAHLIAAIRPPSLHDVPAAAWALAAGFLLWLVLFLALPRPVRTYVLAHELTHALWAWLLGARVSGLRVSRHGGSVKVSSNHFLITLAPYFFPFYTMLVLILYYLLSVFCDLRGYEVFWLGLIGASWGFHFTFTLTTLMQHQTDIAQHGRLFSYSVIYLLNVAGIGLWIVMVASPTLEDYGREWAEETARSLSWCEEKGQQAWEASRRFIEHRVD